jgi:D-arabinose 1-dehydrogenase-like Zn-dependent alcohol dehydrogenase
MTAPAHVPSHRALVREDGQVRLSRRPTPVPSAGELLVTTPVAGLCGTDIQMLRGLRDDPAPVIGHEGVARVVAAGPGVAGSLAPGTRVVVNPTHQDDPSFLLGHNVDGLLQEFTLIPATAVRDGLVVPLEQVPEAELGTLVEPLAAVRYALGLLAAARPRTLVVYGDGTIGQLAVRAARGVFGPDVRVLLVHHTPEGREWSRLHPVPGTETAGGTADGTAPAGPPLGDQPTAALLATPRDGTLDALTAALRLGGGDLTVDLFGGLPPGATHDLLPGVDLPAVRAANQAGHPVPAVFTEATTTEGRRVRLTGHRGVDNGHLLSAAAELCRAPALYRDLVTHVVEPAEAVRVMNGLATDRRRNVDGSRLVKLAVRFTPAPAPSREQS